MQVPIILNYNPSNGNLEATAVRIPSGRWVLKIINLVDSMFTLIFNNDTHLPLEDVATFIGPCELKLLQKIKGNETNISIFACKER